MKGQIAVSYRGYESSYIQLPWKKSQLLDFDPFEFKCFNVTSVASDDNWLKHASNNKT